MLSHPVSVTRYSTGAAGWTMALDKLAAYVATHGD
jgi:hypothetical protein